MKTFSLLALAASVGIASAHTTVYNIWVNDVDQGRGDSSSGYIRSPPNNNPVKDIDSSAMTCNVNNSPAAKTIQVKGGDKITFEWHHNSADAGDDILDSSHKGPILTYIAPTSSNGSGDVWVKLAEDGFSNGQWATDKMIANRGKHDITLPYLAAGTYLLRPEIIALHEADTAFNVNSARGAQFYMECVQIEVTSSGATSLPYGVAIPGVYTYSDPGVVFNIYNSDATSYQIPGPDVFVAGSASSSGSTPTPSATVNADAVATTSATPAPVESAAPGESTPATSVSNGGSEDSCSVEDPAPTTLQTVIATPTGSASTVGTVAKWGQCGGQGFTGSTTCVSGSNCQVQNPYYSQCL